MKKFSGNAGDFIEIFTDEEKFSGTLIPSVNKDMITLKLDSGYNTSIKKTKIKKINVLNKFSEKKPEKQNIVYKKNLPTISILHTGGTIASRVSYETGGVISAFTPEDCGQMI